MTVLGTPAAPILETDRLVMRGWTERDLEPYARMLAHEQTARFITRKQRPYSAPEAWAEVAFFIGHWQMLGFGMFVVTDRQSGAFLGRVGLLEPLGWPGRELAWAITANARGKGYATEAARAVIQWTRKAEARSLISLIHTDNAASSSVAIKLGMRRTAEQFAPLGEPCDIWRLEE